MVVVVVMVYYSEFDRFWCLKMEKSNVLRIIIVILIENR